MSKDFTHLLQRICETLIYIDDDVLEYVIVLKKTTKKHLTQRRELKKNHQPFKHHN